MTELGDFSTEVGLRLKQTRTAQGLSLSRLAANAGIGKGSLSELEAGRRNPTLSTLYALADALGTPLTDLLPDHPGTQVSSPGITAQLLDTSRHADGTVTEVFILTLAPDGQRISGAHAPGTVEHLYLTEGQAAVGLTEDPTILRRGEAATWPGDAEHSYEAIGMPARGTLTITTPTTAAPDA
ncbi:helix-turn-helix domain-containing protein [Nesterenkonia populi]